MKKIYYLLFASLFLLNTSPALAQENDEIISLYNGSKLIFDDDVGFETHYYLTGESSQKSVEGEMNRKFCAAPENVSSYEVIKNYEQAITSRGGTIIHLSRDAYSNIDKETGEEVKFMRDGFGNGRMDDRLLSNSELWAYANIHQEAVIEMLVAKFGIDPQQLKPYGVGATAPQISNATNEGRARNRIVELVQR